MICIPLTDPSAAGEARRQVAQITLSTGFDETRAGEVAIAVTELATNVLKHGGGGEVLARAMEQNGARGVEVLALDRGHGITNVAQSMRDGFSTKGSAGTGLGAIARMSDEMQVFTASGQGTAVLARFWVGDRRPPTDSITVGAVNVPLRGQPVSGDALAVERRPGRTLILVTDGLGHGIHAAEAAREAVRVFREQADREPAVILQRIHAALRHTRGAAAAIAAIEPARGALRYAGVGNIAGRIMRPGGQQGLISQAGTLGAEARSFTEFSYMWPGPQGMLIMHSDGVNGRWLLDQPGLAARDPSLIASVIYRDHSRGRDDATVVVAREHGDAQA